MANFQVFCRFWRVNIGKYVIHEIDIIFMLKIAVGVVDDARDFGPIGDRLLNDLQQQQIFPGVDLLTTRFSRSVPTSISQVTRH